jgi:glutathione synthase/RimK-type ligase-like ATP-grasp enzyme
MPTDQRPIALVTARAARDLDVDLAPLLAALEESRLKAVVVEWDDPAIDWSGFSLVLLRSTWDYSTRLGEFLGWLERSSAATTVHNPLELVRWNVDKHYLADLERKGVSIVPSQFIEPGDDAADTLHHFLQQHPRGDLVIKPAVGAGSRDAQRHGREDRAAMLAHITRLLDQRRSVLAQPYLERVDVQGETALVYFEGRYSHAFGKGALLQRGQEPTRALFAPEVITPRTPAPEERALAERVLAALPFDSPLYARVDLIRAADGSPCLLELELAEPSLYFGHSAGSAARFAAVIERRLALA